MSSHAERLIVFTRVPRAGACKTRLIPALGEHGAAELQRTMLLKTLDWTRADSFANHRGFEVRYTGGGRAELHAITGGDVEAIPQGAGDLGARLSAAANDAFRRGTERVVLVGTDCPRLGREHAARAFLLLFEHDVVVGPARDGGYYLIGLSSPNGDLFRGIEWGSDRVLDQTLARARRANCTVALLEPLSDVDREADLVEWRRVVADDAHQETQPLLTVIIPTLHEEPLLDACVAAALREPGVEVVISASGRFWNALDAARRSGATFRACRPGRASQLNAGASLARGSALLFLHADTLPPPGYAAEVQRLLARPRVAGGAFRFCIDAKGWPYRLIEWGTALRCRCRHTPYGDQGLFLSRTTFGQLGGFAELPIMEDFELVTRLKRRGRVVISQARAVTSARRWEGLGVWRTTLLNQLIIAGFRWGVAPERLAAWYRGARRHENNAGTRAIEAAADDAVHLGS